MIGDTASSKSLSALAAAFGMGVFAATEYVIRLSLQHGPVLSRPEWWAPVTQLNFVSIVLVAIGTFGWILLDVRERGISDTWPASDSG